MTRFVNKVETSNVSKTSQTDLIRTPIQNPIMICTQIFPSVSFRDSIGDI